ncbi:MAG: molybdopterin molybdotransferase MoeA [Dehalococcoidales bacterium]|nr:molybdopterin molybdotransferase MoeA [Dehalococcoidales bacterium]
MNSFEAPLYFDETDSYTFLNIKPVPRIEAVNIEDGLGRILAEDFMAVKNIPPFNRATMDGYAVKAIDTAGTSGDNPRIFDCIDYLYAGGISKKSISGGECIQITTGAKMPAGSDAVVITEDTCVENGRLKIYKPVYYGNNMISEGEDVKKGHIILKRDNFLTPARIGLFPSQGIQQVVVYEKPRVAIISNGEELVTLGETLKDGQIYDVNSFTISAIVKENGCLPLKFGIVGDNPQKIKSILDEALKVADLVLISGGSSGGDKDFLFEILQKLGKNQSYKTRTKTGKSGTFVIAGGKPVLSTPGFPFSCLLNAYTLLVPALRKMAHMPLDRNIVINAKLGQRVEADKVSGRFIPVKIDGTRVTPVNNGGKEITGMARADGYIMLNEETTVIEEGVTVPVILF